MDLSYLTPDRCSLLVVDIQERLIRVIVEREKVVRNTLLLLKTSHLLNIPVVASTQYAARIGDFPPEIKAELQHPPIDKMEFGCFNNLQYMEVINNLSKKIDTLIICGVETHICIYQTVLGALMTGYRVMVPDDAVSSRTKDNHNSGLARLRDIGGQVVNSEMLVYELLQKAGTPQFKELLPLMK